MTRIAWLFVIATTLAAGCISQPEQISSAELHAAMNGTKAATAGCDGKTSEICALEAAFFEQASRADSVLLAQVEAVNPSDNRGDGLLTSIMLRRVEVLSGRDPGSQVLVRWPEGRRSDGQWLATAGSIVGPYTRDPLERGDRVLLLTSRAGYEEQVRVRSGRPVPGAIGATWGIQRVSPDGRISRSESFIPPATVEDLRSAFD